MLLEGELLLEVGEQLLARGVGARARLSEGSLAAILETFAEAGAGETFVAIESERSFREASRLRAMLVSLTAEDVAEP